MVFDKQPVTYILPTAINRKWLTMTDIIDKQRYELLGKLIWPIIVGTVW